MFSSCLTFSFQIMSFLDESFILRKKHSTSVLLLSNIHFRILLRMLPQFYHCCASSIIYQKTVLDTKDVLIFKKYNDYKITTFIAYITSKIVKVVDFFVFERSISAGPGLISHCVTPIFSRSFLIASFHLFLGRLSIWSFPGNIIYEAVVTTPYHVSCPSQSLSILQVTTGLILINYINTY